MRLSRQQIDITAMTFTSMILAHCVDDYLDDIVVYSVNIARPSEAELRQGRADPNNCSQQVRTEWSNTDGKTSQFKGSLTDMNQERVVNWRLKTAHVECV